MKDTLKIYGITFIIFLAIDLIWLGLISPNLYKENIGHLLSSKVNWSAAFLFYLLFIGGLVYFVIKPSMEKDHWKSAFISGGFFGLICYATYDLTNLATLKDWSIFITIIDLIWGAFICSVTSMITFLLFHKKQ